MARADRPYSGVFPIAPTPFTENGDLDLDGQRRVLDCMIDQGVDGICILANYSEQFLLTDEERDTLLELCLEHVAGRVPVIVDDEPLLTRIAARAGAPGRGGRRRHADADAALSRRRPARRRERHGRAFRRASPRRRGIPIMVQDAPLSGVTLSVPFLVRLAREVPLVRYFKIEVPRRRGEAARADRGRRRGDRRPLRRRGIDHADGRSRCRRHRHHAERAPARPDQAGARAPSGRPPRGSGGGLRAASCR